MLKFTQINNMVRIVITNTFLSNSYIAKFRKDFLGSCDLSVQIFNINEEIISKEPKEILQENIKLNHKRAALLTKIKEFV